MPQSWGQENTLRRTQALVSHLSRPVAVAFNLPSRLKQPLRYNAGPGEQTRLDGNQAPSPWGFCPFCCLFMLLPCIPPVDVTTHSVKAPVQTARVRADTTGHYLPKSGTKHVLCA